MEISQTIEKLKKEKDVVILAHYYVDGAIQDVADFVGDSYQLAKQATTVPQKIICFCGVNFMGESAKILNPEKMVIMPDLQADCPMAHMITPEKIEEMREKYEDLAVVAYVNTTAQIKAYSDVCVTSSNALTIVKKLKEKNIFFIPDQNLGSYVRDQVPEKNIILNDGFCIVHHTIMAEDVKAMQEKYPSAKTIVHPESPPAVVAMADFVGSTTALLNYVIQSDAKSFIVGTEEGIKHQMNKLAPGKEIYFPSTWQICSNMKKNTMDKLLHSLETLTYEIVLDQALIEKAKIPLIRMLEMAAK